MKNKLLSEKILVVPESKVLQYNINSHNNTGKLSAFSSKESLDFNSPSKQKDILE
jgi:hypothetical protein